MILKAAPSRRWRVTPAAIAVSGNPPTPEPHDPECRTRRFVNRGKKANEA
nr:MAG TPA: hypothetical protein [Caudoviricetes sp.]